MEWFSNHKAGRKGREAQFSGWDFRFCTHAWNGANLLFYMLSFCISFVWDERILSLKTCNLLAHTRDVKNWGSKGNNFPQIILCDIWANDFTSVSFNSPIYEIRVIIVYNSWWLWRIMHANIAQWLTHTRYEKSIHYYYSWFSISVDSSSTDSINHQLNIFGKSYAEHL